jgi:hypothetical protein
VAVQSAWAGRIIRLHPSPSSGEPPGLLGIGGVAIAVVVSAATLTAGQTSAASA